MVWLLVAGCACLGLAGGFFAQWIVTAPTSNRPDGS